jgi:uncharacterized OB-fold protein
VSAVPRPTLVPRGEEGVFYDRLGAHELVYQRCEPGGHIVFPLRTVCPECGSEHLGLHRSERRGAVHSFTVQHRAGHPFFVDQVPYALALADLSEGFRVLASVPDPTDLAVGAAVEVGFEDVEDDLTLLRLHILDGGEGL